MYHYILAQGQSCEGCINTTVCMTNGRTYLSFTLLFNKSLIDSGCELVVLNDIPKVITEQSCVELSSNTNYSIQCPLCRQVGRDVNYVIPNSIFTNVEDCFVSGTVANFITTYTYPLFIMYLAVFNDYNACNYYM